MGIQAIPTDSGDGAPPESGGPDDLLPMAGAREGDEGGSSGGAQATARQVRGSSLFLVGRLFGVAVNFVSQVLTVRYLSKGDYGAFTYALSMVSLGQVVVTLGLHRSIGRFVTIYEEERDYDRLFGTLLLHVGTVLTIGSSLVLLVFAGQGVLSGTILRDPTAVALLTIMIVLSPIQAIDDIFVVAFATFANPRAIFVRRYVLAPALRFAVVILLIADGRDVAFLGFGYVAAALLGIAVSLTISPGVLRQRGLLQHFNLRTARTDARQIFRFTIPLLTTDLVYILLGAFPVILLGYYRGTSEIAAFRVAQPAAVLNQIVVTSFAVMFTPIAARLYARNDHAGLGELYWRTAVWMAVASLPIFLVTFSLAEPFTVTVYGARYRDSGIILALLALGEYLDTALGFNVDTLTIFGKVRALAAINVATCAVGVITLAALIPPLGAVGAGIGYCVTLAAHNVLLQYAMHRTTRIPMFEWVYLRTYLIVIACSVGLWLVELVFAPGLLVSLVLAAVVALGALLANRDVMDIGGIFPELLRLPLLPRLLGLRVDPPDGPAKE